MKKSWKKINSKIIHKNPWYQLREDDVIRPDGKEGKYFVVDGLNSVAVIAQDKDDKIYLVGQNRYPVGNIYSWEIITGGLKQGSNPLKKAKEELQEETGLLARKWTKLGYINPINGYSSETNYIYLAKNLIVTKSNQEPTENITVKKESLDVILKAIKENRITCGITIVAINKFLLYTNKEI